MKNTNLVLRTLRIAACVALIAAMVLTCAACGKKTEAPAGQSKSFTVEVTDLEGSKTSFSYTSDKASVGEALQAEGLIAGTEGEYGLYVTTVNGISLDWDKDQMYWAFYIDGEYAVTSVDATEITEGAVYSFVPEG